MRILDKTPIGDFLRNSFPEMHERAGAGKCPTCGGEIGEFRDVLSQKEFGISGMCQKCQDETFK